MKTLAGAFLIAMGLSAVASAQQSSPPSNTQRPGASQQGHSQQPGSAQHGSAATSFETADTNKDGQINRVEATAITGLNFATADKNGNASLDRQEYMSAMASSSSSSSPRSPTSSPAPRPSSPATPQSPSPDPNQR